MNRDDYELLLSYDELHEEPEREEDDGYRDDDRLYWTDFSPWKPFRADM